MNKKMIYVAILIATIGVATMVFMTSTSGWLTFYGVDESGNRTGLEQGITQSAFSGGVEVFDIEADLWWTDMGVPQTDASFMNNPIWIDMILGVRERSIVFQGTVLYSDVKGDNISDYPDSYYHRIVDIESPSAEGESGIETISMLNDLYGEFDYANLDELNQAFLDIAGVDVDGLLTINYVFSGTFGVNTWVDESMGVAMGVGTDANRQQITVSLTTEAVGGVVSQSSYFTESTGLNVSDEYLLIFLGGMVVLGLYYTYDNKVGLVKNLKKRRLL